MKPSCKAGITAVALMLAAPTPAAAHTVRSRPASGRVERLDLDSRTIKFSPVNGKAPAELALTRQTKFIHNWHFAPSSELKSGTGAVVHYRTPFFGRPFVTKVVWINAN